MKIKYNNKVFIHEKGKNYENNSFKKTMANLMLIKKIKFEGERLWKRKLY